MRRRDFGWCTKRKARAVSLYRACAGPSGVVAVVGKAVAAGKILVVRQVLFGVLFSVVVLQIPLVVLFSVGCTRTGSAE
jgi:hypothetical protein